MRNDISDAQRGLAICADDQFRFGDIHSDEACLHKSTSNKDNDPVGVLFHLCALACLQIGSHAVLRLRAAQFLIDAMRWGGRGLIQSVCANSR